MPKRMSASGLLGSAESTAQSVCSARSSFPAAISASATATGEPVVLDFCEKPEYPDNNPSQSRDQTKPLILLGGITASMMGFKRLVSLHFPCRVVCSRLPAIRESQLVMNVIAIRAQACSHFK